MERTIEKCATTRISFTRELSRNSLSSGKDPKFYSLRSGRTGEDKPPLETGISGTWLLAVVATQAISVLGTLLADNLPAYRDSLLFLTLCMFLLGCMLYLLLITLIFYRFTFVKLTTVTLTPPYWIDMGAVAITTLAGARLTIAVPEWSFLEEISPFLKGFTLFF